MQSRNILVTAAIFPLALLSACETTLQPRDIAENHVAVLSVTRWDDYKNDLQPQFTMTADQAAASPINDTLQIQQGLTHQFQAALDLQLSTSGALPAGFATGQSGAATTQPTSQPATQPTTQPYGVVGAAPLGTDPFLQYQAGTALFQEVKLLNRYITDAAIPSKSRAYVVRVQISTMPHQRGMAYDEFLDLGLFYNLVSQPTEALENVQSKAKNSSEFATELKASTNLKIQAQVKFHSEATTRPTLKENDSTLPASAPEPSSTNPDNETSEEKNLRKLDDLAEEFRQVAATVSNNPCPDPSTNNSAAICEVESIIERAEDLKADGVDDLLKAAREFLKALQTPPMPPKIIYDTPTIIPLLVTDEIESALAARRADDLQELAFSLSAAYAGIGGKVSMDNLDAAMRNAVGRDYNSLFSVARVNNNTVRVRIGARQTSAMLDDAKKAAKAPESFELNTQTHYLSFLVVVPTHFVDRAPRPVYFGTHTSFFDITKNQSIPSPEPNRDTIKCSIARKYTEEYLHLGPDGSLLSEPPCLDEILFKAASDAQNSHYDKFLCDLKVDEKKLDIGAVNRLWLEMTEERVSSAFDSGDFEMPAYPDFPCPQQNQTIFLLDDGTQTTALISGNFRTTDNRKIAVSWNGLNGGNLKPVIANKLALSDGSLSVTFPSLKDTKIKPAKSTIVVNGPDGDVFTGNVFYVLTPTPAAASNTSIGTFTVSPPHLVQGTDSTGSATLTLVYTKDFTDFLTKATAPKPAPVGASSATTPAPDNSMYPLLTISGQATFGTPLPAQLQADPIAPNAYRIVSKTSTSFSVPLGNLLAKQNVIFTLTAPDKWTSPPPVTLPTVSPKVKH